jgi:hypothetical protein
MSWTPPPDPRQPPPPGPDAALGRLPPGGPSEALFSNSAALAAAPRLTQPARPVPPGFCQYPRPPAAPPAPPESLRPLPALDPSFDPSRLGVDEEASCSLGTTYQLLAVGAQNYFLDVNPHFTHFRQKYLRHTEFAVECFGDDVRLQLGGVNSLDVRRRGEALGDVSLEITLPDLGIPGGRWADAIGYVLFRRIRFLIDDVVVHDHERLWYDLVDRLFVSHGRREALDAMIGRGAVLATDRAHTLLLPLKLAWCRGQPRSRQYLPIGALARRVRLTLEVTTEPAAGCLVLPDGVAAPADFALAAQLLSDQAFLGDDEKRAMLHSASAMLVENPQDVDALTYRFDDSGSFDVGSVSVDLAELNLPVKALAFVAYDENDADRNQYFRYLDCVRSAVMYLGPRERFAPRAGRYFSLAQTYQHCVSCTPDNVHVYSFALEPGERQPSGAVNFAALDRPALRVDLGPAADGLPVKVKVFAWCLNWLVIQNGAAAMRFAG